MPPENPALAATVGARETEGVAGHFLPVLTGEEGAGGDTPILALAMLWLGWLSTMMLWNMVVMVVRSRSCWGGWGLDGAGEGGLLSLLGLVLTLPGWTHLGRESTWDLLEEGRVE